MCRYNQSESEFRKTPDKHLMMLHTGGMNIPRYWARAKKEVPNPEGLHFDLAAWGWSSENREEAERKADERLSSLIARVQQGFELDRRYAYGSRPLREEIIDEFPGTDLQAILTRNSYGSLVLNTAQMMFIDVDFPKTENGSGGFFRKLFGKEKTPNPETPAVARIRESLKKSSDSSFRVYRTAAGLRILATDRLYDPASPEADEIMRSIGADPAFLQLCRIQKSFRARLTPKPWRCDMELPPGTFPRERDQQQRFSRWLTRYEQACGSKATCRFLEDVGRDGVHEQIRPLLEYHDRKTRASEPFPLA